MARNTNKGVIVAVRMAAYPNLRYAFRSRINSSLYGEFGQEKLTTGLADVKGIILGANSPKPSRATKKTATGYNSSYCSTEKIPTLKAAGYKVQPGKSARRATSSNLTQSVYIILNGVKYAWRQSAPSGGTPVTYGSLSNVKTATGADKDLVWGAEFPKPNLMKIERDDGSSYSGFFDPAKLDEASNAGWVLTKQNRNSLEDLKALLPAS